MPTCNKKKQLKIKYQKKKFWTYILNYFIYGAGFKKTEDIDILYMWHTFCLLERAKVRKDTTVIALEAKTRSKEKIKLQSSHYYTVNHFRLPRK